MAMLNFFEQEENIIPEVYLQWLYYKVGLGEMEYDHYWRVIRRLHKLEFYVLVPMDENRYEDGLYLREKFADEYGYPLKQIYTILDGRCSVLEMLVAFAERIENDIMWDPDKGDRTALWFWTMIWNLGLNPKRFSDENFDYECMVELDESIERALSRTYKINGEGGFFPLKSHPQKNFRRTELWYQMQFWVEENYPIV